MGLTLANLLTVLRLALVPFFIISLGVLALAVFLPDLILWIPRVTMANLMQGSLP